MGYVRVTYTTAMVFFCSLSSRVTKRSFQAETLFKCCQSSHSSRELAEENRERKPSRCCIVGSAKGRNSRAINYGVTYENLFIERGSARLVSNFDSDALFDGEKSDSPSVRRLHGHHVLGFRLISMRFREISASNRESRPAHVCHQHIVRRCVK